ncbi:MAG: aspartate aminotransferase family protein [Candidatus Lokiarchaeota archaeon]|nr:aspartate aminotransferase family protein [Candidatus Lokiarchaeota archaeon]
MARQKVILPEKALPRKEVLKLMGDARKKDANWQNGKIWSLVSHASDEHTELLKEAYTMFFSENALSPMAFPSLQKFESEVISMTVDLLSGNRKACGSMTSGGTESILLAVKTYRDWARDNFPQIKEPEMILPSSTHPSFEKAAKYFDVKSIYVPVDKNSYRADVKAIKQKVSDNTILIVGAACDFPRGVVDPITELGALAKECGIGMHVDACLGGYMLPFVRKLGYDIPDFDFSVPGVTSISADIHKYGYGPKGSSTILYRKDKLLKYQYSVSIDWSGGIYASPAMQGTRPGGNIAASWAALNALGENGYLKLAKIVMDTTKKLIDGIEQIPELYILGKPDMSLYSFTSDKFHMYNLADAMEKRGWHLDRMQFPPAIHMTINPHHSKVVEPFLKDLGECVEEVINNPERKPDGQSALYGMIASAPDRRSVKEIVLDFLKNMYKAK